MADLRKLPNLAALRAFEAAARHENFSRAADEIHVTHGAISHQVRALEEELGVALFARHGKRLAITPEGVRFADILRRALTDIAAAEALRASAGHQRLTITTLPSFAARWLSPRIGQFIERYPDLEVMLQSSNQITDLVRESVDLSVRFGSGPWPGLLVEKVMDDYFYPVASPNFQNGKLPKTPQALTKSILLRSEGEPWSPWFRAAGVEAPEPSGGLVFQDSSMLVRAAVEGHGIALGRHSIVVNDILSGDLVRLFDVTIPCSESYYFVCPPGNAQKPQVQAFRNWLFEEIAKLEKPEDLKPYNAR
jgi:LysR family glycine cleavage system transcriptional activator